MDLINMGMIADKKECSPFDYMRYINKKDKSIYTDSKNENYLKDYNIWMINKIFSCDEDFVFCANEINIPYITPEMNYNFYNEIIPKNNIFIKYLAKKDKKDSDIEMICEYFECGEKDAIAILSTISKQKLREIDETFNQETKITKRKLTKNDKK